MEAVEERCKARGQERPLSSYEVLNLGRTNHRVVTVHIFNPHVTDDAIAGFLGRYGEVVSGARYVRGPGGLGFWNGRRQFQVLLGVDPGGLDGLKHPPEFFALGADRGYLFYPRQPPCCRRCRGVGHTEAACGGVRCRDCGGEGHLARDCAAPKRCHRCGQEGHLQRACPARTSSYAEAVGAGGGRRRSATAGGETAATDLETAAKEVDMEVALERPEEVAAAEVPEEAVERAGLELAVVLAEAAAMDGSAAAADLEPMADVAVEPEMEVEAVAMAAGERAAVVHLRPRKRARKEYPCAAAADLKPAADVAVEPETAVVILELTEVTEDVEQTVAMAVPEPAVVVAAAAGGSAAVVDLEPAADVAVEPETEVVILELTAVTEDVEQTVAAAVPESAVVAEAAGGSAVVVDLEPEVELAVGVAAGGDRRCTKYLLAAGGRVMAEAVEVRSAEVRERPRCLLEVLKEIFIELRTPPDVDEYPPDYIYPGDVYGPGAKPGKSSYDLWIYMRHSYWFNIEDCRRQMGLPARMDHEEVLAKVIQRHRKRDWPQ